MKTTYVEPGISLDYAQNGLDHFGRVIDCEWKHGTQTLVHLSHGYDLAGNRIYRHDHIASEISELYQYDQLGQLKTLQRGILGLDCSSMPSPQMEEQWNFDASGNWCDYARNGIVEQRTHNAMNEILELANYDAVGNTLTLPNPNASDNLQCTYDAWNRLVAIGNTIRYEYNGFGQRIAKQVNGTVTSSFFNEEWQELESRTGGQITTYVWGLRYIDDLVYCERGSERLYSMADPNWGVVAVANAVGVVQERYSYDGFGRRNVMTSNYTSKNASDFAWDRAFIGQVLDNETGLMLYRHRYYHTGLGRFVTRDPIGYAGNDLNLYRYVSNSPKRFLDDSGASQRADNPTATQAPAKIWPIQSGDKVKKWVNCLGYATRKKDTVWARQGFSMDDVMEALKYDCESGISAADCEDSCKKRCKTNEHVMVYVYIMREKTTAESQKKFEDLQEKYKGKDMWTEKNLDYSVLDYHGLRGEGGGMYTCQPNRALKGEKDKIDANGDLEYGDHTGTVPGQDPLPNKGGKPYGKDNPDYFPNEDQILAKACCCK